MPDDVTPATFDETVNAARRAFADYRAKKADLAVKTEQEIVARTAQLDAVAAEGESAAILAGARESLKRAVDTEFAG